MRLFDLIIELLKVGKNDPHAMVCIDKSVPIPFGDYFYIKLGKGKILLKEKKHEST